MLPQRSSRRTPATGATEKRGQAAKAAIAEEEVAKDLPEAQATQDDGEVVTPKKRELSRAAKPAKASTVQEEPEVLVTDSQPAEQDLSTQPSSGAKKRKKRKSIGQQSMKAKPKKIESLIQATRQPQKKVPRSQPALPVEHLDAPSKQLQQETEDVVASLEEAEQSQRLGMGGTSNVEDDTGQSPQLATGEAKQKSSKRKRKPVAAQPRKRAKPGPAKEPRVRKPKGGGPIADPEPEASPTLDRYDEIEGDLAGAAMGEQDPTLEDAELEDKPKAKRKKRKSIGQQRPKRKSTDLGTPAKAASNKGPPAKPPAQVKSRQAALTKSSRTSRKTKRSSEPVEEETQNEDDDDLDAEEAEPEVTEPASRRGQSRKTISPPSSKPATSTKAPQPRTQNSKQPSKPTRATSPKFRAPPKNSIPIIIYGAPSPASTASNSDVFDDPLTTAAPDPTIRTINAADVLSQICRELISKTATSLAEKADEDSARRGEWKRKRKTVEMYGEELEKRMLQLTRMVNTNTSLNTQVRAATKEERALRKEIKELEGEREVMKQRKEEVVKSKKARQLEELLSGIAGAVKRGWDMHAKEKDLGVEA